MKLPLTILNEIAIAAPCPATWESMSGDDQVRFCSQCQKNVYDLGEMTAAEAVELIAQNEGRLCLQLYRRADGTVITSDCPVGVRYRIWKRLRKSMAWAASLFAVIFLPGCPVGGNMRSPRELYPKTMEATGNVEKQDAVPSKSDR